MKLFYARQFGLSVSQIKYYNELTDAQKLEVSRLFNNITPGNYIYAVKRDGNLVWERKSRNFRHEARCAT